MTDRSAPPPILYRDEAVVVVAKPSGLLVHRGGWADDDEVAMTLVRDSLGQHVHPVHRLDRGTSGALVFALDAASARALGEAFERGAVEKRYVALVRGVGPERVVVDHPIPRREDGPRVPAVTEIARLFVFGRYSVVAAFPRTGRLHQVRRHLKHLSLPIIGDANYGKGEHNRLFREQHGIRRLALHASTIAFPHPRSGERVVVVAPPPTDLEQPFAALGIPPSVWR